MNFNYGRDNYTNGRRIRQANRRVDAVRRAVREQLAKVIVGQEEVVEQLLIVLWLVVILEGAV